MTITSPVSREFVENVLKGANPNSFLDYSLRIGDRDYAEERRVRSLIRAEDDSQGVAVVLNTVIAGKLPATIEGARVEMDVRVGDRAVRRFTGEAGEPRPTADGSTEIACYTGGYWLPIVKLNRYTAFTAATRPEHIALDMLSRTRRYDMAYVEVQELLSPWITRHEGSWIASRTNATGTAGYPAFASPADVLVGLANETGYTVRDTAMNGCRVRLRRGRSGKAEWSFNLGPNELGLEAAEVDQEGPFSAVVIYRVDALQNPNIIVGPIPIEGSPAPEDAWLWIETSDESAEADLNALQTANDAVDRLSGIKRRATWTSRVIHPYLERGSVVSVVESDTDDEGPYVRTWFGELSAVMDDWNSRTQTYSAELRVLSEERNPLAIPPFRGATGMTARVTVGRTPLGLYFDQTVPWITVLGDGRIEINEAVAAEYNIRVVTENGRVFLEGAV